MMVWPPLLPTLPRSPPAPTVLLDDNLTVRRENQHSLQFGAAATFLLSVTLSVAAQLILQSLYTRTVTQIVKQAEGEEWREAQL